MNFWETITDNLDTIGNVVTIINPVAGVVVKSIDAIVNSENESISDNSVMNVIESMSHSRANSLDQDKLKAIEAILRG